MHRFLIHAAALALVAALSVGCRSLGRALVFGGSHAPHEAVVEGVRDAREEAAEAREDFGEAFELYQRLTTPQAVELAALSRDFEDAIDACADRATDLAERIEAVRSEADALYRGWNEELARFSSDVLREKSAAMLQDSEGRTRRVLAALERVRGRMEPVLLEFRDYALFFHHNLNARAIATLQDTYRGFDAEFGALTAELAGAQEEMAAFLASFEEPAPE